MTSSEIVTAIHLYHNQLYVAYLDGRISCHSLPIGFRKSSVQPAPLERKVFKQDTIITGMVRFRDTLFIATTRNLYSVGADTSRRIGRILPSSLSGCSHLAVDSRHGKLFLFTQSSGVVVVDIQNDYMPKRLATIPTKMLLGDVGLSIVGLDVKPGSIFVGVRNSGVFQVDYHSSSSDPLRFESPMKKYQLENVQDLKECPITDTLYVIDAQDGFYALNVLNREPIFQQMLPTGDVPRALFLMDTNALIQGRAGLYYFDWKSKHLYVVLAKKIATIAKSGNYVVALAKGKFDLLLFGDYSSYAMRDFATKDDILSNIYYLNEVSNFSARRIQD